MKTNDIYVANLRGIIWLSPLHDGARLWLDCSASCLFPL